MSASSGGEPPPIPLGAKTPTRILHEADNSDMELDSLRQPVKTIQQKVNNSQPVSSKNISDNNSARTEIPQKTGNVEKQISFFNNTDIGPFIVYVENSTENVQGKLNAIKVGDVLYEKHPELDSRISNIESIGRNRIRIKFRDFKSANTLLNSTTIKNVT